MEFGTRGQAREPHMFSQASRNGRGSRDDDADDETTCNCSSAFSQVIELVHGVEAGARVLEERGLLENPLGGRLGVVLVGPQRLLEPRLQAKIVS